MANIIVVGGGVVGICSALELLSQGHQVTVIDRAPNGENTCWASCGYIATGEIIPLSKPETLLKSAGWLVDPLGPLSLRLGATFSLLPWLMRFVGNARMSRIEQISKDMADLSITAVQDTQSFLQKYKLSDLLLQEPIIELYESQAELEHESKYNKLRRELGLKIEDISGAEAKEIEPALADDFAAASLLHDWRTVADSKRYVQDLYGVFVSNGGTVTTGDVTTLTKQGGRVTGVITSSGQTVASDYVIIATGAWSKKLAKSIGVTIQLEGVIGYQTILPNPNIRIKHGLTYVRGGFCITPYERGLSIGGSVEFAKLSASPNWQRADILTQKTKRVLPDLNISNGQKAMGRRPLTPDTKPIIGRAPTANNVIFATGHGQMGLTLSAKTAHLVAGLISGSIADDTVSAYAVDRF